MAAGARALVVITAGLFRARRPRAPGWSRAALAASRGDAGALLVGPNCLGVVDTGTGLQLSHALLPPGDVTVLSQSGNVVLDLAALLEDRRIGVARFVSVGNQADLTVVDLMRALRGARGHPGRGRCTPRTSSTAARSSLPPARWWTWRKPVVLLGARQVGGGRWSGEPPRTPAP